MKLTRESLIIVMVALVFLLLGVVQVIREVCAARAEGAFAPLPINKAVSSPVLPKR